MCVCGKVTKIGELSKNFQAKRGVRRISSNVKTCNRVVFALSIGCHDGCVSGMVVVVVVLPSVLHADGGLCDGATHHTLPT